MSAPYVVFVHPSQVEDLRGALGLARASELARGEVAWLPDWVRVSPSIAARRWELSEGRRDPLDEVCMLVARVWA